jgi:hypothetical protein
MLRTINHRSGRHLISVSLALLLACLCLPAMANAAKQPEGIFRPFSDCPATLGACYVGSESGEFMIAHTSVPTTVLQDAPPAALEMGIAGLLLLLAATSIPGRARQRRSELFKASRDQLVNCTEIIGKPAILKNLENPLIGGSPSEHYYLRFNSRVGGQC